MAVAQAAYTNSTLPAGYYDIVLKVADLNSGDSARFVNVQKLLVAARTNYVSATANPNAALPYDTPAKAANSIADALAYAIDGSVVNLLEGEHITTNTVFLGKGIRLAGAGIGNTILKPGANNMRLLSFNHEDAVAEKMTLTGVYFDTSVYIHGAVASFASRGGTISECRITGNSRASKNYCSGVVANMSAGLISRCIIDNNLEPGDNDYQHSMVRMVDGGTVQNTLFYNNTTKNFGTVTLQGPGIVRNCTFVGNTNREAQVYIASDKASVINCLFADNASLTGATAGQPNWQVSSPTYTNRITHCFFNNGTPTGLNPLAGDDPCFKDAKKLNFMITSASPCWNTGLYQSWQDDALDLAGNPRVDNKQLVDIGCYERPYTEPATVLILR